MKKKITFLGQGELRKKLLKVGLGILLLLILAYAATVYYINTQKNEFAALVIGQLNENYRGDISFDDISLDNWIGFRNPAVVFENLKVRDTSSNSHLNLSAGEVELYLSLDDLLKGLVQIKSATVKNGKIELDNYTPLTREEELNLPPIIDSVAYNKRLTNKLLEKETELTLSNLDIEIRHHIKNKLFLFHVDEISSKLEFQEDQILLNTGMDLEIGALGFNLEKGQFINGARARGNFNGKFDLSTRQLSIPSFKLGIDEQEFITEVELNFRGVGKFNILLENEETDFLPTVGLLTEKVRNRFSSVRLERPIYTKTLLEGTFVYRGNPKVDVSFRTADNTAIIEGTKTVNELNFSGRFVNRFYEDRGYEEENKKNFRIELPELKGKYRAIDFQLSELSMRSSPEADSHITAQFSAQGPPSDLNEFLEKQLWSFKGGTLDINTVIDGQIEDMAQLIAASSGQFLLQNTVITNNANQVDLPVNRMDLAMKDNRAILKEFNVRLNPSDRLSLSGELENFSGLFGDSTGNKLHSNFRIKSENIIWDDFIAIFDIAKSGQKNPDPELVLQKMLKDIYRQYDPSFTVSIDRLKFGPFEMKDFKTGMYYSDANHLNLDKTSFDIEEGSMELQAQLNLNHSDKLMATADLEGEANVELLNKIFEEDELHFKGGRFQVVTKARGDLLKIDEVLSSSFSELIITDTEVLYEDQDLVFPISKIDVILDQDNAILSELKLEVSEEDAINFTGEIKNISTLLFGIEGGDVSSELNISSDRLTWEEYLLLFGEEETARESDLKPTPEELAAAERKLKETLREVYLALQPRVTIDIGEFQYQDFLSFTELHTAASYKNTNTLSLERSTFIYGGESEVSMSADIDISDQAETYVDLSLEAKGNPLLLNDVFNNDTFLFQDGEFVVEARVAGDIAQLDSLVAHSTTTLDISKTSILHQPSQVRIPVSAFEFDMEENTARLNRFTIVNTAGEEITFSGEVDHISDLIFDVPAERSKATAEVKVYSEKVTVQEFLDLFDISVDQQKAEKESVATDNAIKPTIRDVYLKFKPRLTVNVDELQLDKLVVQNLKTGFHFEDQNRLYLEESGFDFYEGSISLDAHLDISEPDTTSFSFGFATEEIDLEKLLEAFDYFGMTSLSSAEKIAGLVSLNTVLEGDIDDETGIISNSLKGSIEFNLEEMQLSGFEPMIKSGSKIFRKERLQDIKFQPIRNTLYLSENTVEFPLMEIQSNAFELFVAGHLGFEDVPTNIWIGFPLNNLKKRDVQNVPDKKGYIAAGKKVYVEAKSDDKKGMKYILHLTPKKFYKERDMLSIYREEIREDRSNIRQYKRDAKKSEREAKKDASTGG